MAIIAVVTIEVTTGLINIATAKRCKTVLLVNFWGKARAVVHYVLFGVAFFHNVGLYKLSDVALICVFVAMFISSLIALISYVDQRRQLITKQDT